MLKIPRIAQYYPGLQKIPRIPWNCPNLSRVPPNAQNCPGLAEVVGMAQIECRRRGEQTGGRMSTGHCPGQRGDTGGICPLCLI